MTNYHGDLRQHVVDTAKTWHTEPSDANLRAHMIAINNLREFEENQSYFSVGTDEDGRIEEIFGHKVTVYVDQAEDGGWVGSIRDKDGEELHLRIGLLSIDKDPPERT